MDLVSYSKNGVLIKCDIRSRSVEKYGVGENVEYPGNSKGIP